MLERLGEGGMGTVFRARDELLDRDVAIKQLRAELVAEDTVMERFRAEAMVLARLAHPGIAALYGLERCDGRFYMVMEYLAGETLEALVQRAGAVPWQQAVRMCMAVLDGLQHAHERGVVHRDIKPANIMLTPDGNVKVMDFGIARVMGRTRHTRQGHAVGTPAYMAPEQLRGEDVDGRTDLYALGAVLYELLVGRVAFDADSDYRLMMMQLHDAPPAPGVAVEGLPSALDRIVVRAMAKRPADRYADAAVMRAALAAVLTEGAGAAAPRRRLQVALPAVSLAGASGAARSALGRAFSDNRRQDVASWARDWRAWVTVACLFAAAALTVRAVTPNAPTYAAGVDPDSLAATNGSSSSQPSPTSLGALARATEGGNAAGGGSGTGWSPPPSLSPVGTPPVISGGTQPITTAPAPDAAVPASPAGAAKPTPAAPKPRREPAPRESKEVASAPAPAPAPAPRAPSEAEHRQAAQSAATAFLGRIAAGDVGTASRTLAGEGTSGDLLSLMREQRLAGAEVRDMSLVMDGDRGRATAQVAIAYRTAFGGNRRSTVPMVMELRRQGTDWVVASARVTSGSLR